MKIGPKDLIIQHWPERGFGGMCCGVSSGIKLYHKPSGLEVCWDKERSQHKNKHVCMVILEDLLTEFEEGDIVVTREGLAEINHIHKEYCTVFLGDGTERLYYLSTIAHSEGGFAYKKVQAIKEGLETLEKEFEDKRKKLFEIWGGN